ncbi:VWA domain-containing protein [Alteromonas sp. ASW11-36]|uniref:VWA domain-containing protein n=1 Tax=Alteromonas arenosi TaxID=3055817 RepID=A0ABT7SUY1_9ALTE|nr:VWA domain-containing protein [Alteromonas sp. ASW11-36]MDM7859993.1 VWA domain-containing protein [Alteromonas sp. ASW11-36]
MNEIFSGFDWQNLHFIRPYWLWGVPVVLILVFALKQLQAKHSGWQQILPQHLQSTLLSTPKGSTKQRTAPLWLVTLTGILAMLFLAGPSWEKLPQPVFNLKQGNVIVMDMSLSMRATDVTPDRVTRARFKAMDLVQKLTDGEVGLVAYAGDAFVISPLTEDASNLLALLPSVSPEIMPIPGSEPIRGFEVAAELLSNAGYQQGNIFWFTDGFDREQFAQITDFVESIPFTVHTLAFGTQDGAPIQQVNGELLKDSRGAIVIPKLDPSHVRAVSQRTGGGFSRLSADDTDLTELVTFASSMQQRIDQAEQTEELLEGDVWRDMGAYFVVLLLPMAAYAFRRGLVLCVPVFALSLLLQTQPVFAADIDNESISVLDKIFKTPQQRGEQAFQAEQYDLAASLLEDPLWRGSAHYRDGNYEAALESFSQSPGIDGAYNRGNALARLGQLKQAISAYDEVLSIDPTHQRALENKALVESLLEQQGDQQSEQQDQQQDSPNDETESQQQNGSENSDESQGSDESQSSEGQQEQSDKTDEQDRDSQSDESDEQGTESDDQSSAEDDANMRENQSPPESPEQGMSESTDESELADTQSEEALGNTDDAPLTDEERERQQRLQNLLRKVPDDPAYLLQRKMLLESQQRSRERAPPRAQQDW